MSRTIRRKNIKHENKWLYNCYVRGIESSWTNKKEVRRQLARIQTDKYDEWRPNKWIRRHEQKCIRNKSKNQIFLYAKHDHEPIIEYNHRHGAWWNWG